jgi:hypothetical protein
MKRIAQSNLLIQNAFGENSEDRSPETGFI